MADTERTCILSGRKAAPEHLIRLALDAQGHVAPDFSGRFPGRGAWIALDRTALETALVKGKLRGALLRSFKGAQLDIPDDLPERIAQGLARRCLDRLGLAQRAGAVVTGSESIALLQARGRAPLVLHAADAAPDGVRKLGACESVHLPAGREALSLALGKGNVVHIGISDAALAARLRIDIQRWLAYGHMRQAAASEDSHLAEQA